MKPVAPQIRTRRLAISAPRPTAILLLGFVQNELGAATLELERHRQEGLERAQHGSAPGGLDEDQHEAATARAKQLAAVGTGLARRLVHLVDHGGCDLAG